MTRLSQPPHAGEHVFMSEPNANVKVHLTHYSVDVRQLNLSSLRFLIVPVVFAATELYVVLVAHAVMSGLHGKSSDDATLTCPRVDPHRHAPAHLVRTIATTPEPLGLTRQACEILS